MGSIGIIGGTGPQGMGLGYRFALAGHDVILGSRSVERASEAVAGLESRLVGVDARGALHGTTNADAAEKADMVLLAVPWEGHHALVEQLRAPLAGKVVISCVNPLGFDSRGPYPLPVAEGSAAEQAAALLPDSRVVAAFHHVSAVNLLDDAPVLGHEDVLVSGDDAEAKAVVCELAAAVSGRRGIDAGALRLSGCLEAFTAVLISINKRYRAHSGVAVSGLD